MSTFRLQDDNARDESERSRTPDRAQDEEHRLEVSYDVNGLPHLGDLPDLSGYMVVPSEIGGGTSPFPTLGFEEGTKQFEERSDKMLERLGYSSVVETEDD